MRISKLLQKLLLVFSVAGLLTLNAEAQISGVKTIDPAGTGINNYLTFTAAFNALNKLGVGPGGVTFDVSSDVFDDTPPALTATGTASAPIVFRKAGTGANPVIRPSIAGTSARDAIINIQGGDYITFDGIDLLDSGVFSTVTFAYEYGYLMVREANNACRHITIKNCRIALEPTTGVYGILQADFNATGNQVTKATVISGTCDSNFYLNNTIKARSGIQTQGINGAGTLYDGYIHIENNQISLAKATDAFGIRAEYMSSLQVKGNTITTDTMSGVVYGIRHLSIPNGKSEIQYNQAALTSTVTGNVYGYWLGAASNSDAHRVHHNAVSANGVSATATLTLYGYFIQGSTLNGIDVYNNRLDSINYIGKGTAVGLNSQASGRVNIYRNVIRNINTVAATAIIGLSLITADGYVYNNQVSELYTQRSNNSSTVGVNISSGNWKLYNNTVYLDAVSADTCTAFGTTVLSVQAGNADVELINNILINKSIPGILAYNTVHKRGSTGTPSLSRLSANSDRNIYYAGTGSRGLIFDDGVNKFSDLRLYRQFIGTQKGAPLEQYPVLEDVPFVNTSTHPYDLNISTTVATQAESLGIPLAQVTDDISSNLRNTVSPDAGAYEGNYTRKDITPPGIYIDKFTSRSTYAILKGVLITDVSGVDVSAAGIPRIYYRKKTNANTFVNNTSSTDGWKYTAATNSTSPFSFNIDYSLLYGGTVSVGDTIEYFVIAQDSVTVPNVGYYKGTLNAAPTSVSLSAANFPLSGTINYYVIKTGISGTVNVGAGQTYTSLTGSAGLFNAMNSSVLTGDLEIKITSDLTETGAVALNRFISDDPAYGVRIVPSADTVRTISGTYTGGLIRFGKTNNITVDGRYNGSGNYLVFRNNSAISNSAVFYLMSFNSDPIPDGCRNITIRNTTIIGGSRRMTSVFGVFVGGDAVGTSSIGVKNSRIRIVENKVMRCYTAMFFRGRSSYGITDSIEVTDNTIGSYDNTYFNGFRGIYMDGVINSRIQRNKIFNVYYDSTLSVTPAGIEVTFGTDNYLIEKNTIFNIASNYTTNSGAYGIYLNGSSTNHTLTNNLIYKIRTRTQSTTAQYGAYGIYAISCTGHKLYYNTVNLSDSIGVSPTTPAYSAALGVFGIAANLDIRNNIFANNTVHKGTGSKAMAMWFADAYDFTGGNRNYNLYVLPSQDLLTTAYYTGYNTTNFYRSCADWQAVTQQDMNSYSQAYQVVGFANDTTLNILDGTVSPAESGGIEIAALGIPNRDFNGNIRPKNTGTLPDIGAFEFDGAPGDFKAPVIDSIKIDLTGNQCGPDSQVVSAYINDPGGAGVDTAKLIYRLNGVPQPEVLMTLVSGTRLNGLWKGTIPTAPVYGQEVSYSVWARDTVKNSSQKTGSTTYKAGYLFVDAGLPVIINENTSTRLIATRNQSGTVTWTPGGFVGDTLVTPALPVTTTFYAQLSDGVCTITDSVVVTVIQPVIPIPNFGIDQNYIKPLEPVKLTDSSLNIPNHWKWVITPSTVSFINGTTDSSQNPQLTFIRPGTYTIKLVASNAAGADSMVKTDAVEVYKEYCTSSVGDPFLRDNITRVHLNTLFQQDTTYRDFYAYVNYAELDSMITTTLNPGKPYTLYAFNGGTRKGTVAAWIDYNNNGTFADAGEKLGEQINVQVNDSAAITFTLPADFDQGYTRLRVRIVYGTSNIDPCANYASGEEMLDYRLGLCGLYENPLPALVEICNGDTVIADAMNPGANYSWSNGSTDQSVALHAKGVYTVVVSNDFCTISDTIEVNIKPGFGGSAIIPADVFGGYAGDGTLINPDTVCAGGTLDFEILPPVQYGNSRFDSSWSIIVDPVTTVSGTPFQGFVQYEVPVGSINGTISLTSFMADGDSVYQINLHLHNLESGCDSLLVRYIKVNKPLHISLGNDTAVCFGDTLTLDAGIFATYAWNTGDLTQTIKVNAAGSYTVTVINNDGCFATGAINVNLNPLPVVALGNDTALCAGESITLDAGEFAGYTWNTGSAAQTIAVTAAGTYSVTVSDQMGCTAADTVNIAINPLPDATFTYTTNTGGVGGNITFNATAATGVSYSWKMSDGFVSTQKQPVHQFSSNGTFDVKLIVTSAAGCKDSTAKQVQVNNLSVTDPAVVDQKVEVYPNPYSHYTVLQYGLSQPAEVRINIYDLTGRMVEEITQGRQTPGQYQFQVGGGLSTGVYMVKVEVNKTVNTIRIIKQAD